MQCENASLSPVRLTNEDATEVPAPFELREDKLICSIQTQEPHLKRAVDRFSQYWVENKGTNKNG